VKPDELSEKNFVLPSGSNAAQQKDLGSFGENWLQA
jgi:hypothetical protein